jgi:hypothetical protein
LEDKRLEVSIAAFSKAQASAHFKAGRPKPNTLEKSSDKPDMTDNNKAKP